jgi:hypothetical protein
VNDRITAFLNAANTHTVFGVGLGTAFGSLALITFGPMLVTSLTVHAPTAASILTPFLNVAIAAAQAALPPAILAAAYGRPKNVPVGPVAAGGDSPPTPFPHAAPPQEKP